MRGFERINIVKEWYLEAKVKNVVTSLNKRGIKAVFFPNKNEAAKYILSSIPEESIIGLGGSATIAEMGILDELEKMNVSILSSFAPNLTKDEQYAVMRESMTCDVFLTSTNALTVDGKLVNIDGTGNRIAGMLFGPRKTIFIVGINKIVDSVEAGIDRIKNVAAPMNIRRYFKPDRTLPPCATTGKCMNCSPPLRVCNITTIIEGKPSGIELEVILIGENLGF